jgi:uncharacterized membrane protein YjjP (DUF1212 family)
MVLEINGEKIQEASPPSETTSFACGVQETFEIVDDESPAPRYDWRTFSPDGVVAFLPWLVRGFSSAAQLSDEEVEENFRSLARMLMLLREYEARFGMPEVGGAKDQQWVLQELCIQLYAAGTPIWVLQPVMERAAAGLTGAKGVIFSLFPHSGFIVAPNSGATAMFRYERGYHMHKVTVMEPILVRLASFGTNTQTVTSVPSEFPEPDMFKRGPRGESIKYERSQEDLAEAILDLAAEGTGLFFYTHAKEYPSSRHAEIHGLTVDNFWQVEDSIRELFARLAAVEAEKAIDIATEQVRELDAKYYPMPLVVFFRVVSSAGATGLWFGGSWYDMFVAGALAIIVSLAQGSSVWKQDRILFEVIISFIVGFIAGLISLLWPEKTCFGAMAVGAIIDILQGFKIVYSVMELMSKHTLAGGADFMEAFLFTGLIASFLKFGQYAAIQILGGDSEADIGSTLCELPIDEKWYFVILPISSLAWAYLFMPRVSDLFGMALHGILSFVVYYGVEKATGESLLSTFIGAMAVTLSAGFVSRFTGRQALGNTVTGVYCLVPGAYLARGLFESASSNSISSDLFYNIIVNSVGLGLGAWSGTLLCSPTILGTNRGLLNHTKPATRSRKEVRRNRSSRTPPSMLFF